MNDLDITRITHLRTAGWGYGTIADFTGLTKEQVRTYCTRAHVPISDVLIEHVCTWCGAPIAQMSIRACYCSPACRHKAWRNQLTNTATCIQCGEVFDKRDKPNQKYCSHPCYIRHRFGTKGGRR